MTMDWQPIETAPRDGLVFLALDDLGHPHIVWGDEQGFFEVAGGDECQSLVVWMKIPPYR